MVERVQGRPNERLPRGHAGWKRHNHTMTHALIVDLEVIVFVPIRRNRHDLSSVRPASSESLEEFNLVRDRCSRSFVADTNISLLRQENLEGFKIREEHR